RLGLQDVERDSLRRLRADAGQATELVDQFLDDAFIHAVLVPVESGRRGVLLLLDEARSEKFTHDGLAVTTVHRWVDGPACGRSVLRDGCCGVESACSGCVGCRVGLLLLLLLRWPGAGRCC